MRKAHSVLSVEFDPNLAKVCRSTIETAAFDTCHLWHDLQLGIQGAAAGGAEEVLVDLARVSDPIVGLEGSDERCVSLCDFESGAGYDDV